MASKALKANSIQVSTITLCIIISCGCQNQINNSSQINDTSNLSESDVLETNEFSDANIGSSTKKEDPEFQSIEASSLDRDNTLDEESNYPKETCGTQLPEQRRLYPLDTYPVFVDYSEEALNSIKTEYCKDALKVRRSIKDFASGKEIEKVSIQIASFVSGDPELVYFEEEVFKDFYPNKNLIELGMKEPVLLREIASKYGPIELGEATTVSVPDELKDKPSQIDYKLAQAAQISESQVQELLAIGEVTASPEDFTLGIILPSYIPDGFVIDNFEVTQTEIIESYSIIYKNDRNQCFLIQSWPIPPMGDAPSDLKRLITSSDAMPNLVLMYVESDRAEGLQSISTPSQGYYSWNGFQAITFNSPVFGLNCESITLEQAKSITESFRFLNP